MPHERTEIETAKKIQAILTAKTNATEQEELHNNDQKTTWFGIIREDGELPLFQDYGRYANLMG